MQLNIEKLKKTPDNLLLSEFPWYTRKFLRQLKRGEERLAWPRTLIIDIETAPVQALTWWIHQQEIWINQIVSDWFILTWQAKELFAENVMWDTVTPLESLLWDDKRIMESLLSVINEYDIIVAHNWDNFDIKKIMTRFAIHWLHVDRRIKSIDTYKIAKREFGATSNKLDYLCRMFWLDVKIDTGWFQLWKDSIGDVESCEYKVAEHWNKLSAIYTFDTDRIQTALDTMSEYCANDVIILEELYLTIRSYDRLHPNFAMYTNEDELVCPVCWSAHLSRTWIYTTQLSKYDAYKCNECWATTRSRKKIWNQ